MPEVCVNKRRTCLAVFVCVLILIALGMTGCGGTVGIHSGGGGAINCGNCGSTGGGGTGTGSSGSAPVTLTLLDPPTCTSPRSNLTHLYLSISGVQLNPDANATAASTGWVDAATTLTSAPKQVDMFNLGTSLGNLLTSTTTQGTYGSLRLLLAPNTASITGNQCGTAGAHCVLSGATTTPISVLTENTQGIVINSGLIAGGTITIASTGSNINILFDSCSSLISTSGGYRLLPNVVAWGGAVQVYSITLVDAVSKVPLGSGDAIVALEQLNSGVDHIFGEATPDANGVATIFGPVGTFDFVATGTGTFGGASTMYSPLVLTGVVGSGGTVSATMQLTPQGVASPGIIQQSVDSNVPIDTRISVQQSATIGGVTTQPFTIPLMGGFAATLPTTTVVDSSCGTGACEQGGVSVPAQPLYVQAFGTTFSDISTAPIGYTLFAEPFVFQGSAVKNCTTAAYGTSTDTLGGTISPLPGQTVTASTLTFAGCQ